MARCLFGCSLFGASLQTELLLSIRDVAGDKLADAVRVWDALLDGQDTVETTDKDFIESLFSNGPDPPIRSRLEDAGNFEVDAMERDDVFTMIGQAVLSLLEDGRDRGVQCEQRRIRELSTRLFCYLARGTAARGPRRNSGGHLERIELELLGPM